MDALWEEGVDVGDTVEGLGRSERSSLQHTYVNMYLGSVCGKA